MAKAITLVVAMKILGLMRSVIASSVIVLGMSLFACGNDLLESGTYSVNLTVIQSEWSVEPDTSQPIKWTIDNEGELYSLIVDGTDTKLTGIEDSGWLIFSHYQIFDDKVKECNDFNVLIARLNPGKAGKGFTGETRTQLFLCALGYFNPDPNNPIEVKSTIVEEIMSVEGRLVEQ